jgi:hypothetical protein
MTDVRAWSLHSNTPLLQRPVRPLSFRVEGQRGSGDGATHFVAWGWNGSAQTNVPSGLSNVVGIAAGLGHSLALMAEGRVVAWGSNHHGQIDVPPGLK